MTASPTRRLVVRLAVAAGMVVVGGRLALRAVSRYVNPNPPG